MSKTKKYLLATALLLFLSGCQTIGKTFHGLGTGLQQDGKATMDFLSTSYNWFVENVW